MTRACPSPRVFCRVALLPLGACALVLTPRPVAAASATSLAAGSFHTCALTRSGGVKCWGNNGVGQVGDGTTTNRVTPVDVTGLASGAIALASGAGHACAITAGGPLECWGANNAGQIGDGTTTTRLTPVIVSGLAAGTVVSVAGGDEHTCAVVNDGTVRCWGRNTYGQLGDGTTGAHWSPTLVSGISTAKAVAAGANHTCALMADGSIRCWGYNAFGQVGDGTTVQRTTPTAVTGLPSAVVSLAAGSYHTCAVTVDGSVYCWGYNVYGQIGDATTTTRLTPMYSQLSYGHAVAVTGGQYHTCAVSAMGGVTCVGYNVLGQLGDGTTTNQLTPVSATLLTSGVVAAVTGLVHTCAVTSSGTVQCWGRNYYGELGDGSATNRLTPVNVVGLGNDDRSIAAGYKYTCGLTRRGGVECWGDNALGQLGDGTTTSRTKAVPVIGLWTGVQAVVAGLAHACALTAGGGVECWGANESGELGDGTTTARKWPAHVTGLTSGVLAIAAGMAHTCALTTAGGVKCWGLGVAGQLGDGYGTTTYTPVDVSGLTSGVVALSAGGSHTCAVTAAGGLKCWGRNAEGQLGDGTTINRYGPGDVSGLTSGVVAVGAGESHTCTALTDTTLRCWGNNTNGRLGDNTNTASATPVLVTGIAATHRFVSAWAGTSHSCAVTTIGEVLCWGYGGAGQLGNGGTSSSPTPLHVSLLAGVSGVSLGGLHSCATTPAGPQCWGYNDFGQLGSGATSDRPIPGNIAGLRADGSTAAGSGHTCTITAAGGLRCWGLNTYGQLGDGTTTNRSMPVDVTGLTDTVVAVESGQNHTCAVTASGSIRCWGRNDQGQLGDGTTTDRPTPTLVSGLSSGVVSVSAGGSHTCVVTNSGTVRCWGLNTYGQLGNNNTITYPTPQTAGGLGAGMAQVAAGRETTCAVSSSGHLFCWGRNQAGQLGTGTTTDANSAKNVREIGRNATAVAAAHSHVCAVTRGESVLCWGDNSSGQLGDGTVNSRPLPGAVTGLIGVVAITAGAGHSCALTKLGQFLCWGSNTFGQLGNGTTTNLLTPGPVNGLSSVPASFSAGYLHTCVAAASGAIRCAGQNAGGQLGDGTTTNRTSMVRVRKVVSARFDFDADRAADVAVYRPSSGTWFSLDSSSGNSSYRYRGWGYIAHGDVPAPGDFDGDGIVDPTVYWPSAGTWFVLESNADFTTWTWFGWGNATDALVPGDYDGDGKTDAAVHRASIGTFFVRPTSGAAAWSVNFGVATDVPMPGDYDGDGRTDIAVYRPSTGTWFVLTSTSGFTSTWYQGWGIDALGDVPAPADYDGDGKTDLCVFRPSVGTWFILSSAAEKTTWSAVGWGTSGDVPVPADYDGDGVADVAVYRPSTGTWYVRPSSGDTQWSIVFGTTGDVPLLKIR